MSEIRLEETQHGPAMSNERLRASVHLNKGTFDLAATSDGGSSVKDAAASMRLASGLTFSSRGTGFEFGGTLEADDAHGHGLALLLRREADEGEPEIWLTVTLYEEQPFAVLQMQMENASRSPVRVASFQVLDRGLVDLGSPAPEWKLYKEGWQNWSPALVLPCSGEDIYMAPPVIGPSTQPPAQKGRFVSEMVAAIADSRSRRSALAGFTSTAEQFSQVWLDREAQALTAASYADGIEVRGGQRLSSERLLIDLSAEPLSSLPRYGDALAREMQATPWPSVVAGWCSWYFYWQGISEENVLENLEYLSQHRREWPLEYVQIDDGYQAGIGDWFEQNEKFPHGLRWLAERIHERGYKAALWLAPFMIGAQSRLWQEHPDWAVQYKPGRPYIAMNNWSQECYAMDLTRPDVMQWLQRLFRTVFDDWGYDYVKIDFLYAGAVDGIRYDPNVTRAQAYRRAIETIRRAAGERFILGCGNPMAPSIGLMNGTRIGPDVAPFWYPFEPPREEGRSDLSTVSTLNGIRNILARFWMHERLWLNDPDCLLARSSETALTLDEVRTLTTVIAMSGGIVLDSDNLPRLTPDRQEIASMVLPPYGRSAVPLDLFESTVPQLFQLDCGAYTLLAVFNWNDAPASVEAPLPAAANHVFDVWERKYLGVRQGLVVLDLAQHGCALLRLTPAAGRPQVIGSSFHLLQGVMEVAAEEWDGQRLRLSLRPVAKGEGEVFIHVPPDLGSPRVDVPSAQVTEVGAGVWAIGLRLDSDTMIKLRFGP